MAETLASVAGPQALSRTEPMQKLKALTVACCLLRSAGCGTPDDTSGASARTETIETPTMVRPAGDAATLSARKRVRWSPL